MYLEKARAIAEKLRASPLERDDLPLPYLDILRFRSLQGQDGSGLTKTMRSFWKSTVNFHSGDWLWLDRNSDSEHERQLNLNDRSSWNWLASEIRNKTANAV